MQLHFLTLGAAALREPKEVRVLVSKITQIIPCYNAIISGGENTFLHVKACKSYSAPQHALNILIKLDKRDTFY